MKFCPRCGALLVLKTKNFACPRCSYSTKEKPNFKLTEQLEKKEEIEVIKDKDIDTLPRISAECKKCGNKEAYFWTSQTRGSDETETRFFRCTKCDNTWREYK
ncbi:MAG: transcription factor S [Candidatus Pacearchaeota archaeon]